MIFKLKFFKFTRVSNEMQTIYSSATICIKDKCGLELDAGQSNKQLYRDLNFFKTIFRTLDLRGIMANSKDYDELEEAWVNWRDATGRKMRDKYITYFTLGNKAATLNKLPNQCMSILK